MPKVVQNGSKTSIMIMKREERLQLNRRVRYALLAFLVCVALVLIRLLWLQVIEHSTLNQQNLNQVEVNRKLQSPRGTIFDRNGNPLATSMVTQSLYADPKIIKESPDQIADAIAPYVRIDKPTIVKRLQEDTGFV